MKKPKIITFITFGNAQRVLKRVKQAFLFVGVHRRLTPPAVPAIVPLPAGRVPGAVDGCEIAQKRNAKKFTEKTVKNSEKHLTTYRKNCII